MDFFRAHSFRLDESTLGVERVELAFNLLENVKLISSKHEHDAYDRGEIFEVSCFDELRILVMSDLERRNLFTHLLMWIYTSTSFLDKLDVEQDHTLRHLWQ